MISKTAARKLYEVIKRHVPEEHRSDERRARQSVLLRHP